MGSRSRRGKRRAIAPDAAAGPPANGNGAAGGDRYQKFLPEWMRGNGTAPARPPRPARSKRYRQPRPVGGYTPGKFAGNNPLG